MRCSVLNEFPGYLVPGMWCQLIMMYPGDVVEGVIICHLQSPGIPR